MQPPRQFSFFLLVLSVVLPFGGCEADSERASGPISKEDVRTLSVSGLGVIEGSVTLTSGRWEGAPYAEGGATRPSAWLIEDMIASGDVTGDGIDDAVVFVAESGGGSGSIVYLILVERDGKGVKNTATASIGDRTQIRSAVIDQGVITLELVQHSDVDPMCCPGDLVTRSWVWKDSLAERESVVTGRLGPEVLEGETWRLLAWNSEEFLPDSIEITLTHSEGNFAGSAGCNRYFSAVTQSDIPGDIKVGIGGTTRMMCPPEIMIHEDRYLSILPKVTQMGFLNGRLYLGYLEDGAARILLFEQKS